MSDYKRLTTNEPEDNVETMLNYARCKDKEVFIYDEQGNEVKLTEYIAKHAWNGIYDGCGNKQSGNENYLGRQAF